MKRNFIIIGIIASGLIVLALLFFFLFRSTGSTGGEPSKGFFGLGGNVSVIQPPGEGEDANVPSTNDSRLNKVFKIADGPIASAAFTQTSLPTTTLVRYVMATNGHVMDLAIDVPGAASKPVSNTTIPGVFSAVWGKNATSTVLQYYDTGLIKSVAIAFASSTSGGAIAPTRIQFLPNSVVSIAVSPDGKNIAYLLKTTNGVDGYTADITGSNQRKLFSFFLSQVTLSWPSSGTLLLQTKSAAGVPGVTFSISPQTGVITPLLYASGLYAAANSTFSKVIYQTITDESQAAYIHDMATGRDTPMSFDPLIEKCVWSEFSETLVYCAAPSQAVSTSYLNDWHQGVTTLPDNIYVFNILAGTTALVMSPGQNNQAPRVGIDQIAASPDGKYLLFITRGDHSLWGVRL